MEELKKKILEEGEYFPKTTFMLKMLSSLGGSVVHIFMEPLYFITKNIKAYDFKEASHKLYVAEKFYIHQLGFSIFWFLLAPFTTTRFRIKLNDLQRQEFINFLCEYIPQFKDLLKSNKK
jgi:hypothetical protein